jgi:hypothetical protein
MTSRSILFRVGRNCALAKARGLNTELSVKWLTGRKPILQPWFDALGKTGLPEE